MKNFILIGMSFLATLLCSCSKDYGIPEELEAKSSLSEMSYVFANKPNLTNTPFTRAGYVIDKRWTPGETIRIKFLQDGTNTYLAAQNKVKEIAQEWLSYANLGFVYVNSSENADVKIGFNWNDEKVVWSYIGTDARNVAQNEPSMNLVLYMNDASEIESTSFKAEVLREFGHMLSLINEHQGPDSPVKLDETKARNYFKLQGWTEEQISGMFTEYNTTSINYTEFDPSSIMLWYFPATITQDGRSTQFNSTLSPMDKSFISTIYSGRYVLPQEVNLIFELKGQGNQKYQYDYKGVRIGEYYWVNENFYHRIPFRDGFIGWENDYPITQARLDKYLPCCRLDPASFQVDTELFDRYYGIHYNRYSSNYMTEYGKMYENGIARNWELPSAYDFRQLFAMCPVISPVDSLGEMDVRYALSTQSGSNPMAFNILDPTGGPYNVYWFLPQSEEYNIYNFNMMPSGSTLNGTAVWDNGYGPFVGEIGDIYHLFYTAKWFTKESSVTIHDFLDTMEPFGYHWYPIRWCRKLSDEELGYKLYINSAQNDIKKLDLNEPTPTGYTELEKGYIRGFYVQYILDNPTPQYTVSDIVRLANRVKDNTL